MHDRMRVGMAPIFQDLMRKTGRFVGTSKWVLKSVIGTEEESLKAEAVLGRCMAVEIETEYALDPDKQLQDLIHELGGRLIACLVKNPRSYHFKVITMQAPQAFALPGGTIYIARSLIDLCESDTDELAFVLGHEIGHVVRRHVLNRTITRSSLKLIHRLGSGTGLTADFVKRILSNLLSSAYSQDQELEADRFGATIMRYAGYDPDAAVRFMHRMDRIRGSGGARQQYFATHPDYELRIRRLKEMN